LFYFPTRDEIVRDAKLRTKFLFRTYFAKFSPFSTQNWVYIEITRLSEIITFYLVFMRLVIRSRISLTIEKQRDM